MGVLSDFSGRLIGLFVGLTQDFCRTSMGILSDLYGLFSMTSIGFSSGGSTVLYMGLLPDLNWISIGLIWGFYGFVYGPSRTCTGLLWDSYRSPIEILQNKECPQLVVLSSLALLRWHHCTKPCMVI